MGLFDKKYCDICGKEIKFLGNKKLDDGNCCKDCAGKLSVWFTGRRHSTVADIKRQLAYREENEKRLDNFHPTQIIGDYYKVMIDPNIRCFIVTRTDNWRNYNPDLIPFSQIVDVKVDIDEDQDEIYTKDEKGFNVSQDPPVYEYSYDFEATITLNHDFIDDMSFKLNNNSPESLLSEEYKHYVKVADELMQALTGRPFEENRTNFKNPEVAIPIEPEPEPLAEGEWFCPNCGKRNSGKFCTECGTAKPVDNVVHFCPNCGAKIEGEGTKFCPKCGTQLNK